MQFIPNKTHSNSAKRAILFNIITATNEMLVGAITT